LHLQQYSNTKNNSVCSKHIQGNLLTYMLYLLMTV